jgi:glycosyltransferase involved in cell wall biosynthesis
MPDKLYDYMAAGLPVVNSLRGELEELIRSSQMGIQYEAGNPISLASALIWLKDHEKERISMSINSFSKAQEYDQSLQYTKFADFIESAAADYLCKHS